MDPGSVDAFLKTIDCYVMGSRTYETALRFEAQGFGWPYGDKLTFVLTRRELPRPEDRRVLFWRSRAARDRAPAVYVPLHLVCWRHPAVSAECLRLGLADEIRYSILPILIGDGIPFFANLDKDIALHLVEVKAYKSGAVELRYEVRGHQSQGSKMNESVVNVSELTRRFGARTALASVSLSMSRGAVYGLVGANGAGKTTLIKHVLGLLRAESGSVRVFGLDPVADPVGVLSRIGYLSEENDLPGWMRVDELIRYSRAFYPAWDDVYAEELRQKFALDPAAKIRNLSKGQKARAGLLIALAYRPELLVLDEPSSGLDPIVRRDILGAVIRTIADEGRTVLFSSHLLEEVEQVADHVTMIHQGTIVAERAARRDQGIAPRRRACPLPRRDFRRPCRNGRGVRLRRRESCVPPLSRSPGNFAKGIASH